MNKNEIKNEIKKWAWCALLYVGLLVSLPLGKVLIFG